MRVFFQIFSLFLIMAAGWAFTRRGYLDRDATRGISNLILKLTLPCLIVTSLQKPFSPELLSTALVTLAVAAVFYAAIIALSMLAVRLMRTPRRQRGTLAFSLAFSNCAFIGFPVVSSILGEGSLFVTSIHNVLFNVLAFSAGVAMIQGSRDGLESGHSGLPGATARNSNVQNGSLAATARDNSVQDGSLAAGAGGQADRVQAVLQAAGARDGLESGHSGLPAATARVSSRLGLPLARILNVNVVATIAGFLLFVLSVRIPSLILSPLQSLGSLTTPLAMIVTGAMLARTPIKAAVGDWRVFLATALRLALWPGLAWVILGVVGISGELRAITVIVAGMPAASNTGIIAEVYGGDTETASSVVFLSTLFSILSIPILAFCIA